jgi:CysZ protein
MQAPIYRIRTRKIALSLAGTGIVEGRSGRCCCICHEAACIRTPCAFANEQKFLLLFLKESLFFFRENTLLTPILRAIGQLDDPALLGVLLQTILLSALGFAGIAAGSIWLVHHVLAHGTLGWIAGALSGGLALAAAFWLFVPLAVFIAGLFMGPVCGAVERRWYPGLPSPRPASLAAQAWDGLILGLQVLALTLFSLLLAPTGVGLAIGWLITAWAVGRGFFVAVAMRRMNRPAALAAYRALRGLVLLQGVVLTLGGTIPLLNLLLPILGPAAMVHLVESRRLKSGSWR